MQVYAEKRHKASIRQASLQALVTKDKGKFSTENHHKAGNR